LILLLLLGDVVVFVVQPDKRCADLNHINEKHTSSIKRFIFHLNNTDMPRIFALFFNLPSLNVVFLYHFIAWGQSSTKTIQQIDVDNYTGVNLTRFFGTMVGISGLGSFDRDRLLENF
jgi:hypothetical protein